MFTTYRVPPLRDPKQPAVRPLTLLFRRIRDALFGKSAAKKPARCGHVIQGC